MATAGSFPYEDQFLCSICLHTFIEPVSTPCGHNYCRTCITEYWDSSGLTQCPLCKKSFCSLPQLQVNTVIRNMVEHFNRMMVNGGEEVLAQPEDVPCDICVEPKRKAHKTCMVCLTSFCQTDLEPHQRAAGLKKHKLTEPVSHLKDKVCHKHDKMFELFCQTDQMCVCLMCLQNDHVTHDAIPLEQAFAEKKDLLQRATSEIEAVEKNNSRSSDKAKAFSQRSKEETESAVANITKVLGALVTSLIRHQTELINLIQDKQEVTEIETRNHIAQLEKESAEIRRRRSEFEHLLQIKDPLLFLPKCPPIQLSADTESLFSHPALSVPPLDCSNFSQHNYVRMAEQSATKIEKIISAEMRRLFIGVLCGGEDEIRTYEVFNELWNPPEDKLKMIQQCHALDVTLDPNKASDILMVSEDEKELSVHPRPWFIPSLFGRNPGEINLAMAKEGFSSGRFYYEVCVSGSKDWLLGVAKECFHREPFSQTLPTPEQGVWTLGFLTYQDKGIYHCNDNSEPFLCESERPQTIGVFVDCEKGEVSFYNVDARSLIFSFKECKFTETTPVLTALLYFMVGASISNKVKLYPIFGLYSQDDDNKLVITPTGRTT
ncbi:E3 ubiquitin-protein ligase TRIM7-like [Pholidichthys leucotaenia]